MNTVSKLYDTIWRISTNMLLITILGIIEVVIALISSIIELISAIISFKK